MKVILLNGSRREKGCTYTALSVVADTLRENGIDTEIIHAVPDKAVVTAVAEKLNTADGLVIGSPVYWASPTGEIMSFMDQLAGMAGSALVHKVGATVASARRAGTTATLDVLNKYLAYHQMISVRRVAVAHGPRQHAGRSQTRRRRPSDHAHLRPQHGLDSALHRSREKSRYRRASDGAPHPDQLHPLIFPSSHSIRTVPHCTDFLISLFPKVLSLPRFFPENCV